MNYRNKVNNHLRLYLRNLIGWSTKKHIIVFESDDWGSIRMPSFKDFIEIKELGSPVNKLHYTSFDTIESNEDMRMMFDTLSAFKDKNGKHPVFTSVNNVANPDFQKIFESSFQQYYYEPFTETLKKYPNHDEVYDLWKYGIENNLMIPAFHGREHLNVNRWLKSLRDGNKTTLYLFHKGITGVSYDFEGRRLPDFQAALDPDDLCDLKSHEEILLSGLDLFEKIFGYKASFFVPPNGCFHCSLEKKLAEKGIKYISLGRLHYNPLGNSQYEKKYFYLGKKNHFNQINLARNCFFEPASNGFNAPKYKDWVDSCLKEIEISFKLHKPAVICTHRVNYIGGIHPQNRYNGHLNLKRLIENILKHWPDVEFLTSMQLGELILNS